MANYVTLDYLPDLSASERNSALPLTFDVASPNTVGWDYSSIVVGFEEQAASHSVYRFSAFEGATYDIFSMSYYDPDLLVVYDSLGNAVVINDELEDPDYYLIPDGGLYSYDAVWV